MIKRYKETEIDELANILKKDGVISVPTDTVYGVCARINSIDAYNNLMRIKERPDNKKFPIMCSDEKQIKDIAIVDEKAEKLIHSLMPGPLTLILKKKNTLPEYIGSENGTIAVRMACSSTLEKLIEKTESPVFMTSANQTGEQPCTTLDEIEEKFPNLDAMLEGNVTFNKSSTIIDCTKKEITILRSGPISKEKIIAILR